MDHMLGLFDSSFRRRNAVLSIPPETVLGKVRRYSEEGMVTLPVCRGDLIALDQPSLFRVTMEMKFEKEAGSPWR